MKICILYMFIIHVYYACLIYMFFINVYYTYKRRYNIIEARQIISYIVSRNKETREIISYIVSTNNSRLKWHHGHYRHRYLCFHHLSVVLFTN